VRGDICAPCCGTEREVTVDCPLTCEYLIEARRHEKLRQFSSDDFPNQDIRVTESFLRQNAALLNFCGQSVLRAALDTRDAVDQDVREALDALVRTYRTMQSGLVYETRPSNPYAAAIQQRFSAALADFRERLAQQQGVHTIRDTDVLGILVFLERLSMQYDIGRRRGRAFLHYLLDNLGVGEPQAESTQGPSLLVP
jgi:hypothetical protein